jgi:hypothetical protein
MAWAAFWAIFSQTHLVTLLALTFRQFLAVRFRNFLKISYSDG